ncbi:MAG TPA: hypothetical protein PK781_03800 [Terrimesophilobacter sp.]|nr:hypothetical protein [Terrimesophilobacter sp.]HRP99567.1 hypothetical protein [Terrimesophilobacter sp.]
MSRSPQPRQGSRGAPRGFWADPRFLIGIALVAVSITAVVGIVLTADRTVEVYAAPAALAPGDRVSADSLESRFLRLDGAHDTYLSPSTMPSGGLVVVRPVSTGELVPLTAVGQSVGQRVASVVIPVSMGLASSIGPNSVVDVWSAPETEHGVFGPPSVLVSSATVVRVLESTGFIAGSTTGGVEVLVSRDRIARVLEAVANSDALSLVPVSIPVSPKGER